MKINWKVRLKNKSFWLALVPAVMLIAQIVAGWFDYNLAAQLINEEAAKFINAVFALLVILGIVNDPTTSGVKDSIRAQGYNKPKKDVA
ncbi:phage holin [Virgibacillus sp. Bac332]|uniref:phage holin n=1 Tax=Virgibacillus sp. Bac332 TaxID=2419842 RepID=UPI000EF4CB30|nr:phage holin [Virgibacillus sp. Bac332]